MSDDSDEKRERIGPYQLGPRYLSVPEDEGRLHEAHHVETGEPALVVTPGPDEDWRTKHPWSVRTTHFTDPPALVLQVERSPQTEAPSLHELNLGTIRMAGALSSLDVREDASNPFAREPLPIQRRSRSFKRWGLAGAGLVLAAGFALWLRLGSENPTHPIEEVTSTMFVSQNLSDFPTISYPMPEKPFKGQAKPPCLPEAQVEIRGACWAALAHTAPCPPSTAEYQGKCYMPVKRDPPEPTSVQPGP